MKKKKIWIALVAVMVGSISLTCVAAGMQKETEEIEETEQKQDLLLQEEGPCFTDEATVCQVSEIEIKGGSSEENVVKEFQHVQEMKAYTNEGGELKEGVYVRTKGYYEDGDGGQALYQIFETSSKTADERKVIALSNGFQAVLVMENNTIDVKQFGAKGDGITNDHAAIYAAITSGAKTIEFTKGEYKIDDELFFMNVDGITIEGNQSVLFTDNDYRKDKDYAEHFVTFSGTTEDKLTNITIRNLNIEAREQLSSDGDAKYKNQLAFKYVDGVLVEGCEFNIPETTTALMSSDELVYSVMDFYVDWSNVTVRNCRLINKAGAYYGGCVQFRDIWNGGCENAEFYQNYLYSNGKDELIAVFSNKSTNSHVKNVRIHDNEIIADQSEFVRDICITVGYDDSNQCDNIQIYDNKITGVSDWAFFTLGKTLTNSKIYNNEIIMKIPDDGSKKMSAGVVRAVCTSDTNEVSDNSITIESYKGIGADVVFDGNCNYTGNTVVSNETVNKVFSGDCYAVENDVTVNADVMEIGYNATYVKKNDINIKGNLTKAGFNYYGSTWKKDCQVLENRINIEGKPASAFIHLNGTTLNENQFIFEKNVITTPNCKEKGNLLFLSLLDTTPQTIYLPENEQGIYQGESRYANKAEHLILYERKAEEQPDEEEKEETTEEETTEETTKEEITEEKTTEEKTEGKTEEQTTEEEKTEESTEDSSETITTKEENSEETSEEVNSTEEKKENTGENPKEEIGTREESTEEKKQDADSQQPITTEEIPKKEQSQVSAARPTRTEPFNEEDTKKDSFTVADTVKPDDGKNSTESITTTQTTTIEDNTGTYVETEDKTNTESKIETEKGTEKATEGNVETEPEEEITEKKEGEHSKNFSDENKKILIILGVVIVIALAGGILILKK